MRWTSRLRMLARVLFRKDQLEADLDAELRSFLALLTDRHIARGLSPQDAERAARKEWEGMEQVKEEVRQVRVGAGLDTWLRDARYAFRMLRRSPGFATVVLLTLGLGIGVNTAIFSVVYAVLLRPLPYEHADRLGIIWSSFQKMGEPRAPASGVILSEIEHRSRMLESVAGIWGAGGTFTSEENPEQVKTGYVTPNFLEVLGVKPALGRWFQPDELFGGRPVLILSDGLWRRRFGADPSVIGRGVAFQGVSATVVGVLPRDFRLHFPAGSSVPPDIEVFAPFGNNIYKLPRNLYYIRILARLKPGVTFERAQEDLNTVAAQLRGLYEEFSGENLKLQIISLHADAVRDMRPALIALFGGAAFVLLICCANIANLLLARAAERRKEIAVRSALGASRARILRQLLAEGILLCAASGAAGLALGWVGIRFLLRLLPDYLLRIGQVNLSAPVLAFVAAVSLLPALLFVLAPSLESGRLDLIQSLREGGRGSGTSSRRSVRAPLIVAEIMLGFILVISAGLMIRTFEKITQVRPGFSPERLLTFAIDLPGRQYPTDVARIRFLEDWQARLRSLPGVAEAGLTSHLPLDDYPNWYSPYRPEGVTRDQGAALLADYRSVSPRFFDAMGTRLIAGREFDEQDRAEGRRVVLVDEMLARATWPGKSAVGQKIEAEFQTSRGFQDLWADVVGVVEHVRYHSLSQELRGEIYVPYPQSARNHVSFVVRTKVEPLALAGVIREELRRADKGLAMSKVRAMSTYVEQAKAPASFTALLAGLFAGLALLLAAIGIYGLIHYSVSRRTHEMGVRMTLGASRRDILHLVMREGLLLTAAGMALGLGGSFLVSRYLKNLIYGISANDPLTYTIALAIIPATAILGCWRPAAKAADTNPVDAIRAE